jgi:hypothetical protein
MAYKIKQQDDPIYNIFFLERGKGVVDGIVLADNFETLKESDGVRVYSRDGKSYEFKIGDFDLMIETVDKIDFNRHKKGFDRPFTIFKIESVDYNHTFDEVKEAFRIGPIGRRDSTDTLTVKFVKCWPDCTIKDTHEMEALISGIRRDISLEKLGI